VLLERKKENITPETICFYFTTWLLDEVRRPLLFSILQDRNIQPFLTAVTKVYENKEIKIKLDATLTQPIKINNAVRQGCLFRRLCLTNISHTILLQNLQKGR